MYICAIARYQSDLLYRWTERTLQLNCMYILHKRDVYCHLLGVCPIRRMHIGRAMPVCLSLLPYISSYKNSSIHFGQLWCVVRQTKIPLTRYFFIREIMHTNTVVNIFYCKLIWTSQHNSAIFSSTHTYIKCGFTVWYVWRSQEAEQP